MSHHNPHINPERLARLLTRATEQLDGNTVAALRRARGVALEKQALHKPVFALDTGHVIDRLMPHTAHQWLATAILLITITVGGTGYWHHALEMELSNLDAAILTDDLPMDVFVD
jgi:hypothetical protein